MMMMMMMMISSSLLLLLLVLLLLLLTFIVVLSYTVLGVVEYFGNRNWRRMGRRKRTGEEQKGDRRIHLKWGREENAVVHTSSSPVLSDRVL